MNRWEALNKELDNYSVRSFYRNHDEMKDAMKVIYLDSPYNVTNCLHSHRIASVLDFLNKEFVPKRELTNEELGILLVLDTDGYIYRNDSYELFVETMDGQTIPIVDYTLFPYLRSDMGKYPLGRLIKDKEFCDVVKDSKQENSKSNFVQKLMPRKKYTVLNSFLGDKRKYK